MALLAHCATVTEQSCSDAIILGHRSSSQHCKELQAAGQSAVDMLCVWVGLCGNRAELSAILDTVQSAQVLGEW